MLGNFVVGISDMGYGNFRPLSVGVCFFFFFWSRIDAIALYVMNGVHHTSIRGFDFVGLRAKTVDEGLVIHLQVDSGFIASHLTLIPLVGFVGPIMLIHKQNAKEDE